MDAQTETVILTEPPAGTTTLVELRTTERPGGETVVVRVTVPVKPLMLVRVTTELAHEPCRMMKLLGTAEMVKSGAGTITVKSTLTECDRLPLTPETVTLPEPPPVPPNIESIACVVPFGATRTFVGFTDQVLHIG